MRTVSILGCACILASFAASARADTLLVPQDFATIQEAVDAAQASDTILVAKGTHAPFTVSGKTGLTIRGKGKAIVDGGAALAPVVAIDDSSGITLSKLVIRNSGADGIVVSGDTSGITISKCTIESMQGRGIRLDGSGHLVEKCKLLDTGDVSIETDVGSTDISVEKNRMTNSDGIQFRGSQHVALKNRIKGSGDEGISVVATDCLIEKNVIDDVNDDGIDIEGDNNQILKNRIKNADGNGVEVNPASGNPFVVTGNLFEKNRVTTSDDNGFFVETGGNTFRKNTAKNSEDFGLLDTAGVGANVYENNKFGTVQFE